jgi:hypothetical protein
MLYGAAWMRSAVASHVAEEAQCTGPQHELQTYLSLSLEPHNSLKDPAVIKWWKDHEIVYPTLARMARDFHTVPASSAASERQFSSARHIGTDFRNCLSPTMFEAVQVLKGGYKAGILSVHLEVLALAKDLECPLDELLGDGNNGSIIVTSGENVTERVIENGNPLAKKKAKTKPGTSINARAGPVTTPQASIEEIPNPTCRSQRPPLRAHQRSGAADM